MGFVFCWVLHRGQVKNSGLVVDDMRGGVMEGVRPDLSRRPGDERRADAPARRRARAAARGRPRGIVLSHRARRARRPSWVRSRSRRATTC